MRTHRSREFGRSRVTVRPAHAAVLVLVVLNVVLICLVFTRDNGASSRSLSIASSNASSPGTPTSPTRAATPKRVEEIVVERSSYVAEPGQALPVAGVWHQPRSEGRRVVVRVQVRRGPDWSVLPMPTVSDSAGRFTAYINLGPGQHELRFVGIPDGPVSDPFTVTVRRPVAARR